jgi:hypothetical protein
MSQIGGQDERKLWLKFRWSLPDDFSPRTKRIFSLGNRIEDEVISLLKRCEGLTVYDKDPETGDQFHAQLFGGHFSGSMDFVVKGLPDDPETWHLGEIKSISAKRYKELQKKGLEAFSAEYYAQVQIYMRSFGLKKALFIAYCKDNSELYYEIIDHDAMFSASLEAKAQRIIESPEPPESSYPGIDWYECKFMSPDALAIYWGDQPPKPNCRNCRFSKPDTYTGEWVCLRHKIDIEKKHQVTGCDGHNFITALVPAKCSKVYDDSVEYITDDGTTFWNAGKTEEIHGRVFGSKELEALSRGGLTKERIEDDELNIIRTTFDAEII